MSRHHQNALRSADLLTRLYRDRNGTFAILTAICLPCMIMATSLAVDLGSLYLERRDAQGVVDLAAIAAAADLDHAETAAGKSLAANDVRRLVQVQVTKGSYTADPQIAHDRRFTPGASPYNAVQVTATKTGLTFFARTIGLFDPQIKVSGLGVSSAQATFSLGSRLLSVRDGIPNKLLGALLGGNVTLSFMDYRALLDANVQMGSFLRALATQMHITAGTYNDVLTSNAKVGDVLSAAATVLAGSGSSTGAAALDVLIRQSSAASLSIPLSSLIDLGTLGSLTIGQDNPGLGAVLNVLDLVNASAALANANHQVAIDLGATVPGIASLKIDLTIGERAQRSPWVRVGQSGSMLRTAQTRLRLVAEIGGTGVLAGTRVRLPVALDLAYAEAKLQSVNCASGSSQNATVEILVRPGVAKAWIGEMSNSSLANLSFDPVVTSANIVSTAVVKISGRAYVTAGDVDPRTVEFNASDISSNTVKTVDSSELAESLVSSLLGQLSLDVQVLGVNLTSPALFKSTVGSILAAAVQPLDETVYTIMTALGVHIGEADVQVHGVRCGAATLAG